MGKYNLLRESQVSTSVRILLVLELIPVRRLRAKRQDLTSSVDARIRYLCKHMMKTLSVDIVKHGKVVTEKRQSLFGRDESLLRSMVRTKN
jgi:hypothetical protein